MGSICVSMEQSHMSRFRSDEEIESVASWLRERLGQANTLVFDVLGALRKLPSIIRHFELNVLDDDRLPGDDAYTDCTSAKIYLAERVFDGLRNGKPRARMTFAHELGHILLKHDAYKFRTVTNKHRVMNSAETHRQESEAKRFAGFLLAPTRMAAKFDNPTVIAHNFCISEEAAEVRLSQIRASLRQQSGRLRALPRKVINYLEEAKKRGHIIRSQIEGPQVDSQRGTILESTAPGERNIKAREEMKFREEAALQGYASQKCECGMYRLIHDGSCFTCCNCGSVCQR
jgi:Zn-dependent peptidase ImmA (M78 family)